MRSVSRDPQLTVIGDVCVDLVMGPIEPWPTVGTEILVERTDLRPGGSAANCALAMRHLGSGCRLVSQTGNDAFGEWLGSRLDGFGSNLTTCEEPTSITTGIVHSCGERTLFTTKGHLEQLSWDDIRSNILSASQGDIVLLTGVFLLPKLRARYGDIISELRELGYQIALDTGWPVDGWTQAVRRQVLSWIGSCDHVLLNEVEVLSLADQADLEQAMTSIAQMLKPGATLVAKVGPRGAFGLQDARLLATPAPQVTPFDTIGAGDSFNAGYLWARLGGQDLQSALAAGCETASHIISRFPRDAIEAGELRPIAQNAAQAACAK